MRSILFLMLLAPLVRAGEDQELRFLQAWYALGDPGKTTAAEETFRALHDTQTTPDDLKARCLLGLAECARLKGDEPKARALLDQLLTAHADTDAAARARRILGDVAYLDRILVVPPGRYLDLDDGAISGTRRPFPGKEAEMRDWHRLIETTDEPGFLFKAGGSAEKPWQRVLTSEGRSCWLQVLDTEGSTVVRVVTRLRGIGEVLPAPRDPFCLGGPEGIEVHFEPSKQFASYRIERSADGEEPEELGVVRGPPYVDTTAEEGVRYLYRITGEDEGGARGLPATLEGTRESRGVVSGVAELDRGDGRSFDFLLGRVVADGDITLTATYGGRSSAGFIDALGRSLRAMSVPAGTAPSAWDMPARGGYQIDPGSEFVVPLKGGGVAYCRLELPDDRGAGNPEAILHYEACGDGPVLPRAARLSVKRGAEGGVVISVDAVPPYRVAEVEVTDLVTGESLPPLEVDGGVAKDVSAKEGDIRGYRAVPVAADGRKAAAATATLALFPDGPRAGEFQFHYKQGFSLETGQIVDTGQADVIFQSCAGGIHSITLAAPKGITSLDRVLPRDIEPGTAEALLDLIVAADPGIDLDQRANGRSPASDVFVLRTRHGGWAKLAITRRGDEGGWTEHLATVKYVFNANAPVFSEEEGEQMGGVRIRGLLQLQNRATILKRWQTGWQEITQDPILGLAFAADAREAGTMPDPTTTQEVLFSRQRHRDYEKATFNFAFGLRDDPGLERTRNDWGLQFGNGGDTFQVRMVTDDRSTITDLGAVDWTGLTRRKEVQEREAECVEARHGHVYLVHTVDSDENHFALMRVVALKPGDRVAIEWVALKDGSLARSPGLALDEPTEAALSALLTSLPATPEARWEGREKARATHERLIAPELRIGLVDADAGELLKDLGTVTGLQFHLDAKEPVRVSVFGARLTPEAILDAICEGGRLHWRIEEDGRVRVGED